MGKRENLSGTQVRQTLGDQANGLSLPGRPLQGAEDKGGRTGGVSATATAIGMGLALQSASPDGLQAFAETLPEGDTAAQDTKSADPSNAAQDQIASPPEQDTASATAQAFDVADLDVAAETTPTDSTADAPDAPQMASLGAAPLHGSQDDQPYFKQTVKPGAEASTTQQAPTTEKPAASEESPTPSTPTGPAVDLLGGEDGAVDTVVDTLLGEDGVVDTVVDTLLGEDGVVDTVVDTLLGEDGVVDTVLDTVLGEDGVVDTVVDTLLGEDGVLDTVLGDDGIVDDVVDTLLGDDGVVDGVLGEDGVVDTVVDTVLGEDGVVGTVLGEDGVVDTVLDTVLGEDGIVGGLLGNGGLVGGLLGGITESGSSDPLDDPVSAVVESIEPLTDTVTDTVEAVADIVEPLVDTVTAPVDTVIETTGDLVDTVTAPVDTVIETTGDLVDTVTAPVDTVIETTGDLVDTVTAPVEELVEDITSVVSPLLDDVIGEDGFLNGDDGFLDTLIGGDSLAILTSFEGESPDAPEASVFGGLLGEEDIFGLDVVDTDVGADDLFAGLSGDASLTGTLVDQGLLETDDGNAPDPEIDGLLNDILAGGVEDVLGEHNTFDDLLNAEAITGEDLSSDIAEGGLLADDAIEDAMNTLFSLGGDAETPLLDGLLGNSSDSDAV